MPSAKPAMNGERMPDPAPCASTSTASAPGGSIHMGGIVGLGGGEAARLDLVAVGPAAGQVVRLLAPRRLLDRDRVRLGHTQVAEDGADRVFVAAGEVLIHDIEGVDPALAEERTPPKLVVLDFPDQVRDGGVAVGETIAGRVLVTRPAPR